MELCTPYTDIEDVGPFGIPHRPSPLPTHQFKQKPHAQTTTCDTPRIGSDVAVQMHHQHGHILNVENCTRHHELSKSWPFDFPYLPSSLQTHQFQQDQTQNRRRAIHQLSAPKWPSYCATRPAIPCKLKIAHCTPKHYQFVPFDVPHRPSKLQNHQLQQKTRAKTTTCDTTMIGSKLAAQMRHQDNHILQFEICTRHIDNLRCWCTWPPTSGCDTARLTIPTNTKRKKATCDTPNVWPSNWPTKTTILQFESCKGA